MTGSKTKYFNNEASLKLSKAKNCLIACGRWETFIRKVVLFLPPRCPQVLESSLSAKEVVWRAQTTETKGNSSPTTVGLFFCVRLAKSFKRDFILRAKFQTIFESKTRVKLHIKQSRIGLNYITRLGIEFQYLIWERSIYFPLNSKTSLMSGYSRKNKPDDCFTWIVHFMEVDLLLIIISFGKFFAFLTCKMYR